MAVVATARRPNSKGERHSQFNINEADLTTQEEIAVAVADRFAVISKITLSCTAAMAVSLRYGTTTIAGPFELAVGQPLTLENIICPVVNEGIDIFSDTVGQVGAFGMFHYDTYLG